VLDIHHDSWSHPSSSGTGSCTPPVVFGAPERLRVMPDCGLRTRSWDIAYRKLTSMVAGAQLARPALGL
jgi:5-methyltetrahydropteroyltriglutamate--homocysteine methyltransferase